MFFGHNLKSTSTKSRSSARKIVRRPKAFAAVVSLALAFGGPVLASVEATEQVKAIQHVVNHPCTIETGHHNAPAVTKANKTFEPNTRAQVGTADDPLRMMDLDNCATLVRQIKHSVFEPFRSDPWEREAYWECSRFPGSSKLLVADFRSRRGLILEEFGSMIKTVFTMDHESLSWTWIRYDHGPGEYHQFRISPLLFDRLQGNLIEHGSSWTISMNPAWGQSYSCYRVSNHSR